MPSSVSVAAKAWFCAASGRPRAHLSEAGEPEFVRYEKKIYYPERPAVTV
jgi:hypothetical protein